MSEKNVIVDDKDYILKLEDSYDLVSGHKKDNTFPDIAPSGILKGQTNKRNIIQIVFLTLDIKATIVVDNYIVRRLLRAIFSNRISTCILNVIHSVREIDTTPIIVRFYAFLGQNFDALFVKI